MAEEFDCSDLGVGYTLAGGIAGEPAKLHSRTSFLIRFGDVVAAVAVRILGYDPRG